MEDSAAYTREDSCAQTLAKTSHREGNRGILPALKSARELINQEFRAATLDEYLYAFEGFHQGKRGGFFQRPWEKVPLEKISSSQIQGMPPKEFIAILKYAMEIEDPIKGYSFSSGEGYRHLLPRVGRFMGKTIEEQARLNQESEKESPPHWCEGSWCAEERRHGNYLARIIKTLTGEDPSRDNPVTPLVITSDEERAIFHHFSRQATEWSASSAYLLLAAHANGELRQAILNVARDEIKHLTIISAANLHLFGPRPLHRLWGIVKKTAWEFFDHRKTRTTGKEVSSKPITFLEILAIHYYEEMAMRKYLRTLPPTFLEQIFEAPSIAPKIESVDLSLGDEKRIEKMTEQGQAIRASRVRWKPKDRHRRTVIETFERINRELFDSIIQDQFEGFLGAEDFESEKSDEIVMKIFSFNPKSYPWETWTPSRPKLVWVKVILFERLREFQIRNNRFLRTLEASR